MLNHTKERRSEIPNSIIKIVKKNIGDNEFLRELYKNGGNAGVPWAERKLVDRPEQYHHCLDEENVTLFPISRKISRWILARRK